MLAIYYYVPTSVCPIYKTKARQILKNYLMPSTQVGRYLGNNVMHKRYRTHSLLFDYYSCTFPLQLVSQCWLVDTTLTYIYIGRLYVPIRYKEHRGTCKEKKTKFYPKPKDTEYRSSLPELRPCIQTYIIYLPVSIYLIKYKYFISKNKKKLV